MAGLTWRQALEWREELEKSLEDHWNIINPVKMQQVGVNLDDLIVTSSQKDDKLLLAHTATGICAQDEFFIDRSDWLLCNFLNATKISIGTVWEIGYAWAKGKKILTVLEPGSIHDHQFIRRRSHVFTSDFEEALEFLAAIAI